MKGEKAQPTAAKSKPKPPPSDSTDDDDEVVVPVKAAKSSMKGEKAQPTAAKSRPRSPKDQFDSTDYDTDTAVSVKAVKSLKDEKTKPLKKRTQSREEEKEEEKKEAPSADDKSLKATAAKRPKGGIIIIKKPIEQPPQETPPPKETPKKPIKPIEQQPPPQETPAMPVRVAAKRSKEGNIIVKPIEQQPPPPQETPVPAVPEEGGLELTTPAHIYAQSPDGDGPSENDWTVGSVLTDPSPADNRLKVEAKKGIKYAQGTKPGDDGEPWDPLDLEGDDPLLLPGTIDVDDSSMPDLNVHSTDFSDDDDNTKAKETQRRDTKRRKQERRKLQWEEELKQFNLSSSENAMGLNANSSFWNLNSNLVKDEFAGIGTSAAVEPDNSSSLITNDPMVSNILYDVTNDDNDYLEYEMSNTSGSGSDTESRGKIRRRRRVGKAAARNRAHIANLITATVSPPLDPVSAPAPVAVATADTAAPIITTTTKPLPPKGQSKSQCSSSSSSSSSGGSSRGSGSSSSSSDGEQEGEVVAAAVVDEGELEAEIDRIAAEAAFESKRKHVDPKLLNQMAGKR